MLNANHTDAPATGMFDRTVVQEIRANLGETQLSKLMEFLASDLAKAEVELADGYARRDLRALKLVAYTLKGTAGQYGASPLAREASKLGALCAASKSRGLAAKVRLVRSLCQQTVDDSLRI